MPGKDVFGARDTLDAGRSRLLSLEPFGRDSALGQVSRLPFSIKVLLEAVLRTCDGYEVTEDDVRNLAAWDAKPLRRSGQSRSSSRSSRRA